MTSDMPTLAGLAPALQRSESLTDPGGTTHAPVDGAGKRRTPFRSVLFEEGSDLGTGIVAAPECLKDLNLDQVIGAITAGREEYALRPLFEATLCRPDMVIYRQEVARDVQRSCVAEPIRSFAGKMQATRKCVNAAGKAYYRLQGQRWFLDAVLTYCDAIASLQQMLTPVRLNSAGMTAFYAYLTEYAASSPFVALSTAAEQIQRDLAAIRYCVVIQGSAVTVRSGDADADDYSAEIGKVFARFRTRAENSAPARSSADLETNHVEARILDFVALSYPREFTALTDFQSRNQRFLDETMQRFDREIQFYMAYMEFIAGCRRAGLDFCYPDLSAVEKDVFDRAGFDLALADKLVRAGAPVVTNDFYLSGPERIIVVSGPNQGGKTTFARTFGQLHHLAGLGLPVPGTAARLFLFDRLFTHFEHGESSRDLRGKLQDDLVRMHAILDAASPCSIIVINEIFSSTTLSDALLLGKKVVGRIAALDCLCVCVTFLDELASLDEKTVSMVSTVVPEQPAQRTFKLVRKPADGRAYAIAIAAKYRLTYDCLRERLLP